MNKTNVDEGIVVAYVDGVGTASIDIGHIRDGCTDYCPQHPNEEDQKGNISPWCFPIRVMSVIIFRLLRRESHYQVFEEKIEDGFVTKFSKGRVLNGNKKSETMILLAREK